MSKTGAGAAGSMAERSRRLPGVPRALKKRSGMWARAVIVYKPNKNKEETEREERDTRDEEGTEEGKREDKDGRTEGKERIKGGRETNRNKRKGNRR